MWILRHSAERIWMRTAALKGCEMPVKRCILRNIGLKTNWGVVDMSNQFYEKPVWQQNLVDRSAPDQPGQTEVTAVRLRTEDLEWLRSLPHGVSYNIRKAVGAYKQSITANDSGD
jgi:hypothetical protein